MGLNSPMETRIFFLLAFAGPGRGHEIFSPLVDKDGSLSDGGIPIAIPIINFSLRLLFHGRRPTINLAPAQVEHRS